MWKLSLRERDLNNSIEIFCRPSNNEFKLLIISPVHYSSLCKCARDVDSYQCKFLIFLLFCQYHHLQTMMKMFQTTKSSSNIFWSKWKTFSLHFWIFQKNFESITEPKLLSWKWLSVFHDGSRVVVTLSISHLIRIDLRLIEINYSKLKFLLTLLPLPTRESVRNGCCQWEEKWEMKLKQIASVSPTECQRVETTLYCDTVTSLRVEQTHFM